MPRVELSCTSQGTASALALATGQACTADGDRWRVQLVIPDRGGIDAEIPAIGSVGLYDRGNGHVDLKVPAALGIFLPAFPHIQSWVEWTPQLRKCFELAIESDGIPVDIDGSMLGHIRVRLER